MCPLKGWGICLSDLVICQSDNPFGLRTKSDLFYQVTKFISLFQHPTAAQNKKLSCDLDSSRYDEVSIVFLIVFPFRLTNNMYRAVYQRWTVTCLATLTESDCTVVLQQKCDNATLIIFIFYYYYYHYYYSHAVHWKWLGCRVTSDKTSTHDNDIWLYRILQLNSLTQVARRIKVHYRCSLWRLHNANWWLCWSAMPPFSWS